VGTATTVDAGGTEVPHEEPIDLVVAPGVANVLVNGQRGHLTVLGHLPYGLKLVRITFPRGSGVVFYAKSLRAIDAHGRTIGASKPVWGTTGVRGSVRWWQAPQPPPSGPCAIHARGLPGLKPEWGHVAAAIQPYPGKIAGQAFVSCIDTEYYLHNWPLETAILLDAAHPGARPAAIPDMHAIPGEPGLFATPGDWNGKITAQRIGNAWLVVAGGSGLEQRIQVLRHLHPMISLSPHDTTG
jgi:hypothetical protein